jgi:hypothetical protein
LNIFSVFLTTGTQLVPGLKVFKNDAQNASNTTVHAAHHTIPIHNLVQIQAMGFSRAGDGAVGNVPPRVHQKLLQLPWQIGGNL